VSSVDVKLIALIGNLKILVKPLGSIYVDNLPRANNTDVKYSIDLPAGPHVVKAVHPSWGMWEKDVDIKPDGLHEITIDFNKIVTIRVVATPVEAEIYVDKKASGYWTPSQLKLRVGRHSISVRRDGYVLVGEEQVVNLEDELKTPLKFTLKIIQ